jgi:hypothetical protein
MTLIAELLLLGLSIYGAIIGRIDDLVNHNILMFLFDFLN